MVDAGVSQIEEGDRAPFLRPSVGPRGMDRFLIRSAILRAIRSSTEQLRGTVLDVGCGQMPYREMLLGEGYRAEKYIGLDLEVNPIHRNQPDIVWIEGKIPLADESVDSALCTEVLEHIPDPDRFLTEVARVLKPGGTLVFTVPFLWPLHEVPYDNYRYTPFSLQRHLTCAGFRKIDIWATGGWDYALAQMIALWMRRRPGSLFMKVARTMFFWPLFLFLASRPFKDVPKPWREGQMITGLWGWAMK